ncbi:MAG: AP2 domain-containing protein [Planctomycetota bacterium]
MKREAYKRKQIGNYSSQYKGVSWIKSEKKWRARIKFDGRSIHIGRFDDEKAAARAYDAKARELFGELAALNLAAD